MGLALLVPSLSVAPAAASIESVAPAMPAAAVSEAPAEFVVAAPNPQVPAGYGQVAETASLRLHLNREDSKIAVEDKRSGKLWTSNPLEQLGEQKTILDD